MLNFFLAIFIGKVIYFFTRRLNKGGGSAAPGYYALKIDPNLTEKLAAKIKKHVIITGTNGKTTTARMLALFARTSGLKVIHNSTGSNLERGIVSTLISQDKTADLAIWEVDEAAFNSVALKIKPDVAVFLNAFRDQLDRYGEVDSVVKKWQQTLSKLDKSTTLIVNGDDSNTANLEKGFSGEVRSFGIPGYKIEDEAIVKVQTKKELDVSAQDIKLNELTSINFVVDFAKNSHKVDLPIPGIYHVYDFLAAFLTGLELKLDPQKMIDSLKDFTPAFGRVESFNLEGSKAHIFLIKNPAGANQIFFTLKPNLKPDDRVLIALNDNFADGTDVSWIWDAVFEQLSSNGQFYCSGTRAEDMAVRLKYAGIDEANIKTYNSMKQALEEAKRGLKGQLFILPTYTALLELQAYLAKHKLKSKYWEEKQ